MVDKIKGKKKKFGGREVCDKDKRGAKERRS